ncbi:unnamed protein product [Prorocentrum cordatum]|uniref:Uncharacterized protein n=1 Tax=Prorocentrum cordatum TaxID=2364126 RepID=A0ABN9WUS2_9DINO|nr:unnamed protein product [Polarella glacialis]
MEGPVTAEVLQRLLAVEATVRACLPAGGEGARLVTEEEHRALARQVDELGAAAGAPAPQGGPSASELARCSEDPPEAAAPCADPELAAARERLSRVEALVAQEQFARGVVAVAPPASF